MTATALFILAVQAAAITIVFVRGSIFDRVRESGPSLWQELARCPLCAGVWIGFGWSLVRYCAPFGVLEALGKLRSEWLSVALDTLATGALTGTLALLVAMVLNYLEDPPGNDHHHHDDESVATEEPDEEAKAESAESTDSSAGIAVDVPTASRVGTGG